MIQILQTSPSLSHVTKLVPEFNISRDYLNLSLKFYKQTAKSMCQRAQQTVSIKLIMFINLGVPNLIYLILKNNDKMWSLIKINSLEYQKSN